MGEYYIVLNKMLTPSGKYLYANQGDVVKYLWTSKCRQFFYCKDITGQRQSPLKIPIANLENTVSLAKMIAEHT